MEHSLILLVLGLLHLSLGLPLDGSVKTEAAPNSKLDGSKLDATAFSQAQLLGQSAEGPQVVGEVEAASEALQNYEDVQGAAGSGDLTETQISGQATGEAQPQISGPIANDAQATGKAQAGVEAPAAVIAQASGDTQVNEQPQNPGQVPQTGVEVQNVIGAQSSGQTAGGAQAQPPEQINAAAQVAGGTQANNCIQPQISAQTLQPQISKPSASGAPATEKVQGVGGSLVSAGAQAYLAEQVYGGAESQSSQLAVGEAQSQLSQAYAGGIQADGKGQMNERTQDVPVAASSQGPVPEAPQPLSPSFRMSQKGLSYGSESLLSQPSKQFQPQVIGIAMPSGEAIKMSGDRNNIHAKVGISA